MLARVQAFLLLGTLVLSSCATGSEAPLDATASSAPGSPGYLVAGLSERNAVYSFGHATTSLALAFQRLGGGAAVMFRAGCGSTQGLLGSRSCDLTKTEWQVLKVDPGEWRARIAVEGTHQGFSDKRLRDQLPDMPYVHVGSGEIVYVGDYILDADYDAQQITVGRHGRDDAAAQRALATFPGLRDHPMIYRDPAAKTATSPVPVP